MRLYLNYFGCSIDGGTQIPYVDYEMALHDLVDERIPALFEICNLNQQKLTNTCRWYREVSNGYRKEQCLQTCTICITYMYTETNPGKYLITLELNNAWKLELFMKNLNSNKWNGTCNTAVFGHLTTLSPRWTQPLVIILQCLHRWRMLSGGFRECWRHSGKQKGNYI